MIGSDFFLEILRYLEDSSSNLAFDESSWELEESSIDTTHVIEFERDQVWDTLISHSSSLIPLYFNNHSWHDCREEVRPDSIAFLLQIINIVCGKNFHEQLIYWTLTLSVLRRLWAGESSSIGFSHFLLWEPHVGVLGAPQSLFLHSCIRRSSMDGDRHTKYDPRGKCPCPGILPRTAILIVLLFSGFESCFSLVLVGPRLYRS